jgi:plastocyanin
MKKFLILILFLFLVSCSQEPTIEITSAPAEVSDDSPFVVNWQVNGQGDISHTAIHFDYQPRPADYELYEEASAVHKGIAPQEFSENIRAIKVGFVYYRAHAIIDDKNIYSPEFKVEVIPYETEEDEQEVKECPVCLDSTDWTECNAERQSRIVYVCDETTNYMCQDREEEQECVVVSKEPAEIVNEFRINVNDREFNPEEISATPGETVRITFTAVPPQGFAGADIRDKEGLVKTGKISPDNSLTVKFIMPEEDFKLTNYWPAKSIKKADMWVRVK